MGEEVRNLCVRRSMLLGLANRLPDLTFGRVRVVLVRLAGIEVGAGTVIGGRLRVTGRGGTLHIGRDCFINGGCQIDVSASVTVGDGAALGQEVLVITNTHVVGGSERRAAALRAGPVIIGAGSWLGARVVVLPDTVVGAGSVIAAGAVVARSVDPDTLAGGVPAEPIRSMGAPDQRITP